MLPPGLKLEKCLETRHFKEGGNVIAVAASTALHSTLYSFIFNQLTIYDP
jgi:hypothetical protein